MRDARFGLVLTQLEKSAINHLAKAEELSQAAILRRLIREAAKAKGLWPNNEERKEPSK